MLKEHLVYSSYKYKAKLNMLAEYKHTSLLFKIVVDKKSFTALDIDIAELICQGQTL